LLDRNSAGELVAQIAGVVEAEAPIHQDVMLERLKASGEASGGQG
jgi:hypothetical protein